MTTTNPGRVLPDLSKGNGKMEDFDAQENGTAKRKSGHRVQMQFIGRDGAVYKSPPPDCIAVKGTAVETQTEDLLELEKLDKGILFRLAAFGASVLGRNEVGTEPDPEAAADGLKGRWEGFRQGVYRSIATGSATPIILLALERALRDAGKSEDEIRAKVEHYTQEYNAGEDDESQKKSRRTVAKLLRGKTAIAEAEKAIRAEREAARLAANPKSATLEDL